MTATSSGRLFTGYGGLALAVEHVFGARTLWVAEHEPPVHGRPQKQPAAAVLAHRFPDAPNLGDVRRDWENTPRVDILEGGYPCQGQSAAGKRQGQAAASWMWPAYFDAIRTLRPRLAIGENVRNHLNMDLWAVIADLQSIGYAAVWGVVAASDVGACHRRERVFWVAWDETAGAPAQLGSHPVAYLESGRWMVPDLFGGTPLGKLPTAGAAYAGAAYAGAAYAGAAYAGAAPSRAALLKTPTANLAINGGSQHPDKRRQGGHGPTLADQVEHLFPTPRTTDTNGPGVHGDGGMDLRTAVTLLPTPTASSYGSNQSESDGAAVRLSLESLARCGALLPTPDAGHGRKQTRTGPLLAGAVELLPTPRATDGTKGGPNQRGSSGDLMLPSACQPERWGEYAEAVARQESFTRPAPDPTIPGRHGKPRLNPALPEWMMGLPAGWITDTPGITARDALKLAGNGVVTFQAIAALEWLTTQLPPTVKH